MRPVKIVNVVDSHTAGEPTRVVIGGVPLIPGKDMREKKAWLASEQGGLRRLLMQEPRGHRDMFGAVVTPPASDDADVGVVFMDCDGYLDMCVHASIGTVTVLLELGMFESESLVLNTPAGKIHATAELEESGVREVTVRNVPSFFHSSGSISVANIGEIHFDVAYGGNYFALVSSDQLGLELDRENLAKLIEVGMTIKRKVKNKVKLINTNDNTPSCVDLVVIYNENTTPPKNLTVFGAGQFDRSPCGTGHCAKMALLHSQGRLKKDDEYRYQSILGTEFKGRIVGETTVNGNMAIIPEITGSASITGIQQLILDKRDPFKEGFCFP